MKRAMGPSGFTLVELLVAAGIAAVCVTGVTALLIAANRVWYSTSVDAKASTEASEIIEKMVYGVGTNRGLRSAQASTVNVTTSATGWTIFYAPPGLGTNYFTYSVAAKAIYYSRNVLATNNVVGRDVASAVLRAYTNGLTMTVTVARVEGRFSATNRMATFVRYRN
jgi:prepilin-type N-terminal cleavage/methylation domain-containing protein